MGLEFTPLAGVQLAVQVGNQLFFPFVCSSS